MSTPTEEYPQGEKPRSRRKSVWVVVLLLGAGLVVFVFMGFGRDTGVGGGLVIEADPETRIYIGGKPVGTEQVYITWGQLFGGEGQGMVTRCESARAITAEMLSGPGAIKVYDSGQSAVTGTGNVKVTQHFVLVTRRADGSLDPVFALVLFWSGPGQASGNYLVPIRLRKGSAPSAIYFDSARLVTTGDPPSRIMRLLGRWRETRTKCTCTFTPSSPPPELAEEIKSKGLWEPGERK